MIGQFLEYVFFYIVGIFYGGILICGIAIIKKELKIVHWFFDYYKSYADYDFVKTKLWGSSIFLITAYFLLVIYIFIFSKIEIGSFVLAGTLTSYYMFKEEFIISGYTMKNLFSNNLDKFNCDYNTTLFLIYIHCYPEILNNIRPEIKMPREFQLFVSRSVANFEIEKIEQMFVTNKWERVEFNFEKIRQD